MPLTLSSADFSNGHSMPASLTCEGTERSPALAWSGAPPGTASFALIVDDPDAPDPKAPKMTYVHWVLYNIPAGITALAGGMTRGTLPPGTREGITDGKGTPYVGPCPPIGRHRYFFKLYALGVVLADLRTPTKTTLEIAMRPHVLEQATLMGTYEKTG